MDTMTMMISAVCVVMLLVIGYLVLDKVNKSKPTANKKVTKREKPQYSKVIVGFVILLNVLFTIAILYVFLQTGNEPTSLVVAFFAFTTGELFMLANIKKTKVKKRDDFLQ